MEKNRLMLLTCSSVNPASKTAFLTSSGIPSNFPVSALYLIDTSCEEEIGALIDTKKN